MYTDILRLSLLSLIYNMNGYVSTRYDIGHRLLLLNCVYYGPEDFFCRKQIEGSQSTTAVQP